LATKKALPASQRKNQLLGKKVLITAGPTWVALDSVRVISNTATGSTGILLAHDFIKRHARVTLILGPVGQSIRLPAPSKVIPFNYFHELQAVLASELKSNTYDIVIHSAAVSDYEPSASYNWKVSSGLNKWSLLLKPTPKLIDKLADQAPHALLVGFKYDPDKTMPELIDSGKELLNRSRLDMVVANTIRTECYHAYIITNGQAKAGPFITKKSMAANLIHLIEKKL
jgi:phosphopantothenoylcysteine synthetase/decarboxylase